MSSFLYRVSLIAVEPSGNSKTRKRNNGNLTCFETDNSTVVRREIQRLEEMINNPAWLVKAQISVERAEISDFIPVDPATFAPLNSVQISDLPADHE